MELIKKTVPNNDNRCTTPQKRIKSADFDLCIDL